MSDERSLERAARSFLESGPTRAPEAAVMRALRLIQTTPQERDLRIPRRFSSMPMLTRLAAAAAIGVLAIGGTALLVGRTNLPGVGTGPSEPPGLSPSAALQSATPVPSKIGSVALDYSDVEGTILVEHLGNAIDLSEMPTEEYHPERRRFYFMDPSTMTGTSAREFLAGQPPAGKLSADVSRDGTRVVFMDTATKVRDGGNGTSDPLGEEFAAAIWIANLDGTGLQKLTTACACEELDPAFDPTGTKVVFVHLEGAHRLSRSGANGRIQLFGGSHLSWLAIRDLATGTVTKLEQTVSSSVNAIPEQPAWSPDGDSVVFNRTTWGNGELPESGKLQIVDLPSGTVRTLQLGNLIPGDSDWSPDGQSIVFTSAPVSSTGSLGADSTIHTVSPDGTSLTPLFTDGWSGGAAWMPDGRILYMSDFLWIMNADGSDRRPVNVAGSDLTDLPQGFAYIPHWIPAAP